MSAVGTTRSSNISNGIDTNGHKMDEPDLSHLPQWKRDFILKKRSLIIHQKEQEQKKLTHKTENETQLLVQGECYYH